MTLMLYIVYICICVCIYEGSGITAGKMSQRLIGTKRSKVLSSETKRTSERKSLN